VTHALPARQILMASCLPEGEWNMWLKVLGAGAIVLFVI
jgi:hypothetical protein